MAVLLPLPSAAAFAEVKKSDLGAACVSQNRIINGQVARREIRTGDAVRRHDGEPLPQETACTVGGKLVNPKMDPDRELPKSNMQIPQQDSTARV
ncbi:hypothetical protein [Mesorhizobium sp.]|uniref:hypothetical protein n=1 Tax=Mesorhizobium sp. TaxID=1871066 RepID=UPI001218683C|nr:hypothetical protein [Mesorhizobium sp.]TIO07283.1 MAG: hypothetical protein E5X88_18090 [Mesorhizobium sp.]TIO35818.1 MAG: hypothetical protein E5X89_07030 [Mesorhizobium sp.]